MVFEVPYGVYRLPRLEEITGFARSTLYQKIKAGIFPPPLKTGKRASAWRADEVRGWLDAISAGASDDDLKVVVSKMVTARKIGAKGERS